MALTVNARNRLKAALCDANAGDEICDEIDLGASDSANQVFIAAGNVALSAGCKVCVVNKTSGAATQVTLPPSPRQWASCTIIDGKGDAATNNITVIPATGTIDGGANAVIKSNYGDMRFLYNGTEWNCTDNNNFSDSAQNLTVPGTATVTGLTTLNGEASLQGPVDEGIGGSTAAAGTTTADAGVLPAGTAPVYPTTAADGTKGVRIHATDKVTGRSIAIGNGVSNAILKVYAPSGGTINGAAADAAFSSASGKGVFIICLSAAGNTWLAF